MAKTSYHIKSTRHRLLHAALLAGLLSSSPAFCADGPSTEARLKKLEGQLDQVLNENAELKKQLGWDGKAPLVLVKAGGKESSIKLGGLIQGQAEFGDAPDARYNGIQDRFLLRRARLNVAGSFLENFAFKVEGEFGAGSLSEKAGYSAQFTDACVTWTKYDFATPKFGQFKTPFGYEQLVSDPGLLTIERSLANDRLTDSRQIGLGLSGDFFANRLGYSAGVFNGTSVNNSFNDNDRFMWAGRLTGVPVQTKIGKQDLKWSVGVNGLMSSDNGTNGPANITKSGFGLDFDLTKAGKDNIFAGDRTAWGVDTQFRLGRFGLDAEYLRAHFEPLNNTPAAAFDGQGWYVMGTYYVVPKKLLALVKFESFDPNTSVSGNTSDTWTFGLNYYIKGDDLKLVANYLLGNPAGGPDNQGRFLTRVQLCF